MSVNTYTTSDLIELIKTLGHFPQGNLTFTPAKLLSLADLEMRTAISAMLKEADEGYFQRIIEFPQDDSGEYRMPTGAMGSAAYAIQIRNGQAIWPVSRQEVAEMTTTTFPSVGNWSYYIRGNTLHLLPIQFGGFLRITYERRASKLVLPTACARISSVAGQVVTVESLPSGWVNGNIVEIQQAQPQFDTYGPFEITDITGTDVTLDGDITDLAIGDYLCLEDQTCVPQIPVEFHALLAQRVVCSVYEIQGYLDKKKAADETRAEMESALVALITPRTQAAPKVINPSFGGRKPGTSWSRFNPPASGHS